MTRYDEYQALYLKFDEALDVLTECGRMENEIATTDDDFERSKLMLNAVRALNEAEKAIWKAQESHDAAGHR